MAGPNSLLPMTNRDPRYDLLFEPIKSFFLMGFLILRIVGILCLRFRYIFISIHILTHLLTLTGIKMEKAEE